MKINKTVLPNGMRIVTIPMPDSPSVTILAMVEAGSNHEPGKVSGISHFLEHMVFKGTSRRPKPSDISRELDGIGAEHNAFTSNEYTGYYAKVAAQHAALALDVIADIYTNPLIDAAEMEKEKGVIVEEIRMYEDMPQARVGNLFMELMYGDQPAGRKITGTEETVRGISRQDIIDYRALRYVAPSTVVAIAGNFDERLMIAAAEKQFAGVPGTAKAEKPPVAEAQSAPAVRIGAKKTDQTHIILGVRSYTVSDPRRAALSVLAALLGKGMSSRLFHQLREEMGICYYVHADSDLFTDHGFFAVSAGVDNSRVDQAIKAILAELARTAKEPVSEAELRKVKDYIAGNTMLSLETSDSVANFAGGQETLKGAIETPEEAIARIRAVTALDLMAVAKDIFVTKNLNLAVVGDFADEGRFQKLLSF